MENLIKKFYDLCLSTNSFTFQSADKTILKKELPVYENLFDCLNSKQLDLFLQFISMQSKRHNEELQIAYETGFKTAINLMLECLRKE